MKTLVLILVVVGVVIAAYVLGRSQGCASGFEDGVAWSGRSADMTKAVRAKAILDLMEQTNYARVSEALNHDIDYAILGVLDADEHLIAVQLPGRIQQQDQSIREAFRSKGTDETTGYSNLAEFRRKHPTDSTDDDVVKAVKKLIEKY
jgi:hypothetical protein